MTIWLLLTVGIFTATAAWLWSAAYDAYQLFRTSSALLARRYLLEDVAVAVWPTLAIAVFGLGGTGPSWQIAAALALMALAATLLHAGFTRLTEHMATNGCSVRLGDALGRLAAGGAVAAVALWTAFA